MRISSILAVLLTASTLLCVVILHNTIFQKYGLAIVVGFWFSIGVIYVIIKMKIIRKQMNIEWEQEYGLLEKLNTDKVNCKITCKAADYYEKITGYVASFRVDGKSCEIFRLSRYIEYNNNGDYYIEIKRENGHVNGCVIHMDKRCSVNLDTYKDGERHKI